ncbi:hypothetical protein [Winogradskyella costae]|uniref:hypothetical protein n=1 Tax=Winogradskyella costae TaxID=2697008 RepID=UPI0015CEBDEB|nr:hypothetical protein [Winogradskyella costae]
MKEILTVLLILISTNIFGQKNMLDTLTIDSKTKIIGRYPQYDKNKTYEKYNFIIEDSAIISNFIKNLKLGYEVPNSSESPSFRITIVKNFKEEGIWTINPIQKSVMTHDGHTYKFDIEQITKFNEKFPFQYFYKKIIFKSPEEYQENLIEQKKNPKFLFDYKPQFKYEGSFEIEFKKSSKFSSPKTISEFLYPYIDKIAARDAYRVSYILNKKNIKNNGKSYTMTINGSKKIYESLKIKKLKNENWESTVEDGWFFFRE